MTLEYCFHLKYGELDKENQIGECICDLKRLLNDVTALNYDNFHCVAYYLVRDLEGEEASVYNPELARNCPMFTTDDARALGDFTALMKRWKLFIQVQG